MWIWFDKLAIVYFIFLPEIIMFGGEKLYKCIVDMWSICDNVNAVIK